MGHPSIPGREDPVTRYVRGHGGTLAHVLAAIGRFHARYGHWPDRLCLYPETLAALVQDMTPRGFYMLQLRLDVVSDLERDLFCTDSQGNIAVYRVQAQDYGALENAAVWLGLSCDDTSLAGSPRNLSGGEPWR